MLLSASTAASQDLARMRCSAKRPLIREPTNCSGSRVCAAPLRAAARPGQALFSRGDRLGEHLRIAAEPLGLLDELAALDLEDLHPAAAFVVGRGDLHGRDEAAEGEVLDLLEALAHVFAGRPLAALGLDGIADRLHLQRDPEQAAVTID